MAYVSMADLGQSSRQQGWWDWFFSGSTGPPPSKGYKQVAFKQQQSGQVPTANKAWGGMEYEAKADEDLDAFAPQGYDAAQALAGSRLADVQQWGVGLADDPVPAATPVPAAPAPPVAQPSAKNKAPIIIATSLVVGGLGAMLYGALTAPREAGSGRRLNGKRRN